MEKLEKEPVLIVGFGKTGESLAKYFHKNKIKYGISERKDDLLNKISCYQPDYLELGKERVAFFSLFPLVIPSPGVNPKKFGDGNWLEGDKVISELDYTFKLIDVPVVAVTGTNGKSTVTSLVGEILQKAQVKTFVGGNLGKPFIEILMEENSRERAVIEVSSYQLEYSKYFTPRTFVLTNLTLDHQERHKSMENYWEAKISPLRRMGEGSFFVVNYKLKKKVEKLLPLLPKVFYFTADSQLEEGDLGLGIENGSVTFYSPYGKKEIFFYKDVYLKGKHNLENIMAGILATFLEGVDILFASQIAKSFQGIEHRLEKLDFPEIEVYNDSKATNPDSTIVAIDAMDKDFILILGGSFKDVSYDKMGKKLEASRCKKVILTGETSQEILQAIKMYLEKVQIGYEIIDDFDLAVKEAFTLAVQNKWTLLFSPACASFDNFSNFSERGKHFKKLISQLYNEKR